MVIGTLGDRRPLARLLLQETDACLLHTWTAPSAGLWTQANLVEPERLVRDMIRMGVRLKALPGLISEQFSCMLNNHWC